MMININFYLIQRQTGTCFDLGPETLQNTVIYIQPCSSLLYLSVDQG